MAARGNSFILFCSCEIYDKSSFAKPFFSIVKVNKYFYFKIKMRSRKGHNIFIHLKKISKDVFAQQIRRIISEMNFTVRAKLLKLPALFAVELSSCIFFLLIQYFITFSQYFYAHKIL
jgi:hypothetical protein